MSADGRLCAWSFPAEWIFALFAKRVYDGEMSSSFKREIRVGVTSLNGGGVGSRLFLSVSLSASVRGYLWLSDTTEGGFRTKLLAVQGGCGTGGFLSSQSQLKGIYPSTYAVFLVVGTTSSVARHIDQTATTRSDCNVVSIPAWTLPAILENFLLELRCDGVIELSIRSGRCGGVMPKSSVEKEAEKGNHHDCVGPDGIPLFHRLEYPFVLNLYGAMVWRSQCTSSWPLTVEIVGRGKWTSESGQAALVI
ncbi:hypothetical protein BKA70DRAFT_1536105 [Coprinopsis sp. MPI-PUGE-AT-0042]|nr:hypothetical protein BKA70DRAFT_1536105 [Coprinopsis sp. MPI-PUGE-AT-0042]